MNTIKELCKDIVEVLTETQYNVLLDELNIKDDRAPFRVKVGQRRIKDYLCTLHTIQCMTGIDIVAMMGELRND